MAITKAGPGSVVVSNKIVSNEVLVEGGGPIVGTIQPANSIIDKIFLRVIDAPTITEGNIMCEIGTESDDPDNIVADAANGDNILDGGTTLPPGTIFDLTSATGSNFTSQALATGNAASETASALVTVNTPIFAKFTSSTAVSAAGKFELTFVYRVFE